MDLADEAMRTLQTINSDGFTLSELLIVVC